MNETLQSTLDEISKSLISQEDYKDAYGFLYLHDTNEEWMQDFLYQYLNWQMDNHNYVDTAETFSAIQGYQDTYRFPLPMSSSCISAFPVERSASIRST